MTRSFPESVSFSEIAGIRDREAFRTGKLFPEAAESVYRSEEKQAASITPVVRSEADKVLLWSKKIMQNNRRSRSVNSLSRIFASALLIYSMLPAPASAYAKPTAPAPVEPPARAKATDNSAALAPVNGTRTVCPSGCDYVTLTAAFADLTFNGVNGATFLELKSTYAGASEIFPITIGNIAGNSATNTITVRPETGATNRVITSANATATIDLNGAQNVSFDGRPGGTGTAKQLTIANTSTSGAAVRFVNDAIGDSIKYTTITGVNASTTGGVVVFSTTTGANGNDNNTIDNCDIRDGATTPTNLIYSLGTTTSTATNNSGNTISNSNLFNFFAAGSSSSGILLSSGSTNWTIDNNSLYQTATRTSTSGNTHAAINISNASGNGFDVKNNKIGGDSPNAAVTAQKWTINGTFANIFNGISVSAGTAATSSVQGNTIANISILSTSTAAAGYFAGINITNGNVNVGTTTANTIGATTGTGNIVLTQSTNNGGAAYGISQSSSGTVSVSNNNVGSITLTTSNANTLSTNFFGIRTTAGTNTISTNIIGSAATANSINSDGGKNATTNASTVRGISQESSSPASITNNSIANLTYSASGGTGPSTAITVYGIAVTNASNNITGNIIRNLSSTSGNTGTNSSVSVAGILMNSNTATQTISQNIIHSLSNTNATTAAVNLYGIYYAGSASGTNTIERNFVHSLSVSSTGAAIINGIYQFNGSSIYRNNMIRLGVDAAGNSLTSGALTINGILADPVGTNNYYHNSIYIGGGGVTTGTASTAGFRRVTGADITDFRDNILVNNRSNGTGTGKHYAIALISGSTTFTSNYNVFNQTGTGSVFGIVTSTDSTTFANWKINTSQDNNSFFSDPQFLTPNGTSAAVDLHINPAVGTNVEAGGVSLAAVTDDYDGQTRSALTPVDIGADAGNFTPFAGAAAVKLAITNISPASPTAGGTFSVTVQSQDAGSVASNVATSTGITLSNTGGGAIGGTTTGTITAGTNQVVVSGVTLSTADTGVTLTATRTSGDILTAGASAPFTVTGATTFYSKSTGNLDVLSTWGTNTDGTGTAPASFTGNNLTLNIRNNATPTIGANWSVSGTGSKIILGDATVPAINFTIPGSFAVTGTIDVPAASSGSNTLTIQNSIIPTFGTINAASTIVYDGAGSQTITATNYGNLTVSGSGSRTIGGSVGIAGTFTLGSNSYTVAGSTINFNGSAAQTIPAFNYNNLTSSGTGGRTLAGAGTIGIAGTFTPGTNTYAIAGSAVDFNGTAAQTVPVFNFNDLTISGARATNSVTLPSGTIGVAGAFNPSASFTTGNYSVNSSNVINFSSAGSQTIPAFNYASITNTGNGNRALASSGVVGISGTGTAFSKGSGTYTTIGSTVNFSAASGTVSIVSLNYNNLTVSGAATFNLNGNTTIGGSFTQSAGTFNVNDNSGSTVRTFTITGDFSQSGGTFNLISAAAQGNTTVNVGGNAAISGTGAVNFESTASTAGVAVFAVTGNFTATSTSAAIVDFGGTGTVAGNEFRVGGNFSKSGTGVFYTTSVNAANGFVFNGANQNFSYTGAASDYTSYVVNSGSTLVMSTGLVLGANTNPASSFTVSGGGALNIGTNVISASGTGDSFTLASGGTLRIGSAAGITSSGAAGNIQTTTRTFSTGANYTYNGSANQAVGNGLPATVANLTIVNTGTSPANVVTGAAAQSVTGAFTIQQGAYSAGSGTLAVGGNFSNGGTFTANSGTVSLNGAGAQAISGSTTFNNLSAATSTARTLTFAATGTTTVNANLTLTGTSGNLLSLRSSVLDAAWNLVAPPSQTINFVDARDSNASGGQTVRATNSTDTANNVNWSFSAGTISFFGAPYANSETNADHAVNLIVRRSGGVNGAVSVNYSIADGTATVADNDYSVTSATGTLNWADGDSADKTLPVTVKGDTKYEANETVTLTLSGAAGGATLGTPNPATLTIANDDAPPTLSINSVSVGENGGSVDVTVTQSAVSGLNSSFNFISANGSATAGQDYAAISGSKTITAGNNTATITIPILDDGVYEGDETFTVTIDSPVNATVAGTGTGTVTINDNEPATIQFSGAYSVCDGGAYPTLKSFFDAINIGEVTGNITVNIAGNCAETATATLNQWTESPASSNFTMTIQPSGGAARIVSGAFDDSLIEFNGADRVTIDGLNAGGDSLNVRQNGIPDEGLAKTLHFTNDASGDTVRNTTLEIAPNNIAVLIDGGAASGNDNLTITGNTVTATSGNAAKLIVEEGGDKDGGTRITNNSLTGFNEAINLRQAGNVIVSGNNLSNPAPGAGVYGISVSLLTGTNIVSQNVVHDLSAALQVVGIQLTDAGNITVERNRIYSINSEGGACGLSLDASGGASTMNVFNNFVSLIPATVTSQSVEGAAYSGGGGSALNFYHNTVLIGGTETGVSNSYGFVRISGGDTLNIKNNIFFNNRVNAGTGTGNHFAAGDGASGSGVWTSDYNVFVGTGASPNASNFFDYNSTATPAPVSFATWQAASRDTHSTAVNPGGNYTVAGMFVSAVNLHLKPNNGTAAIAGGVNIPSIIADIDGDSRHTTPDVGADEILRFGSIAFDSATYSISESGGTVAVQVNRVGGADSAIFADYGYDNGSATGGTCGSGGDFGNATGTLNWGDGDASPKTIVIPICGDAAYEGNEDFTVKITNRTASVSVASPMTAQVTIVDDDDAPTLSINDVSAAEGDSGATAFTFTITKTGATGLYSQVSYGTAAGTSNPATGGASCAGGADYVNFGGTVSFTAIETQKQITVNVCGDAAFEPNEIFFVNLSSPSGASLSDAQGLGTILNDDAGTSITVSLPTGLTALRNTVLAIPVFVSDMTGNNVGSYDFAFSYDPAALSPAPVPYDTAGTLSSGMVITPDTAASGSLRISGFSPGYLSGAGTLIYLRFNVIGTPPVCSAFSFSGFVFNEGTPGAVLSGPGGMCERTGNIGGRVTYGTSPMLQTVPGVTMNGTGSPNVSASTDAGGLYNLSGFGSGAYTVTPSKTGGAAAGTFTGFDASLAAQYAVGVNSLKTNQRIAADVSGNGIVTSFDASLIAQYVVGITLAQPNLTGQWRFVQPGKSYANVWVDYANEDYEAIIKGDVSGSWTPSAMRAANIEDDSRPNPVQIMMADASVMSGDEIVVPINISDLTNRGVYSFDFEIRFDESVFELVEGGASKLTRTEDESSAKTDLGEILSMPSYVEKSNALSRNYSLAANRTAKGVLRITGYGVTPLEGAGELLRLRFRAKKVPATVRSKIVWSAAGLNEGDNIPVLAQSAIIEVK